MPIRNAQAHTHKPSGVCDAIDGSNAPPGAMLALQNLVPSPATAGQYEPRPAREVMTDFPGFNSPGVISAVQVIGNICYGMIASARNPGKDEPFAFNLVTRTFLAVTGITNANTPASPPASGSWVPPIIEQVGRRVVVTHPGFPGGALSPSFYSEFVANTHSSTTLDGYIPAATAIPVGTAITGAGIPAGATFVSTAPISIATTVGSATQYANTFTVASAAGLVIGLQIVGFGVGGGFITNISGTTITSSLPVSQTTSGNPVSFIGQSIVISLAATATANNVDITASNLGSLTTRFGWFDLSGLNETLVANTVSGSPLIGLSDIFGLQPGLLVTGPGIPAGTSVRQITNPTLLDVVGNTNSFQPTQLFIFVPFTPGAPLPMPFPGQAITGLGIPPQTFVASAPILISSSQGQLIYQVPMTQGATGNFSSTYSFTGIFSATLSANATATGTASLVFTGGSPTAPLWGAGDTAVNPLPSTPVGVSQRNGRAWFACGIDGIPFSDSLLACVRSGADQALNSGDGLAVTALGPLGQISQLTASVVQATVVFQGASKMQVITGDPVTQDLRMNDLPVDTGTNAPLSLTTSKYGLHFISPLGLRIIDTGSNVTDVIGEQSKGISVPFINAAVPSRVAAAGHDSGIRFVTQNAAVFGSPYQEWWYHFTKGWSGPHTCDSALLSAWDDNVTGIATYVTTSRGTPHTLFRSDPYPTVGSDFVEDGLSLVCKYQTSLQPSNADMHAVAVVQSTIGLKMPDFEDVTIVALNEAGGQLGFAQLPTDLGQVQWGFFRQTPIPWNVTLVCGQLSIIVMFRAAQGEAIGNLRIKYSELGYQYAPPPPLRDSLGNIILGPTGFPIAA